MAAPLVIAKDQDGRPNHVYQGGIIQWLSDEQAAHFLGTGLVVEVGGSAAEEGGDEIELPAKTANVPVLEDWLIANEVDGDGNAPTREELKPLNKAALWDRINAVWESLG